MTLKLKTGTMLKFVYINTSLHENLVSNKISGPSPFAGGGAIVGPTTTHTVFWLTKQRYTSKLAVRHLR